MELPDAATVAPAAGLHELDVVMADPSASLDRPARPTVPGVQA